MPVKPPRHGDADGPAEQQRKVEELIAGLDVAELMGLVGRLTSAGPKAALAALQDERRPNRRRPRRHSVATYRVRIDLKGTTPPIWRRLELGSDMFLDEVHQVIQAAFGWTDSHLHRFAVGPSVWDKSSELYLCPFDLDEGDEDDEGGIGEQDVRLDEVLVQSGDKLLYVYDYGDDWEHVVRLEGILDRPADAPRAVCTGGRRVGPPEDCGGVWGYEELLAESGFDDEQFDLDEVNGALSMVQPAGNVSAPMAALLRQVRGHRVEHQFAELIRQAQPAEPARLDADDAAPMVRRYVWLLDRVGDEGIKLSESGYLPPAHVAAATIELNLADEWIGKGNRENQTLPVLELRESAQKMGLLRKHRGRLLLTRKGQKLRHDPVGLWWHVVARMLWHDAESIEQQAGIVSLIGVAAGRDITAEPFRILLNDVLGALGWRSANGAPLGAWSGTGAARDTVHVLRHMGAFTHYRQLLRSEEPTPAGIALARAILLLHT